LRTVFLRSSNGRILPGGVPPLQPAL